MKINKKTLFLTAINIILIAVMSALVVKTGIALGGNSDSLYIRISAWLTAIAIEFTVTVLILIISDNKTLNSIIWKMVSILGFISVYYNFEYNLLQVKQNKLNDQNQASYIHSIDNIENDTIDAKSSKGVEFREKRFSATLESETLKIQKIKSLKQDIKPSAVDINDFKALNWLEWIRIGLTSSILFLISLFLTFARKFIILIFEDSNKDKDKGKKIKKKIATKKEDNDTIIIKEPKSKKEVVIVAKEQPKTKPKSKKEVVIVAKEQPKTKPKSKKEVVIVAKEQPKTKPKSKKEVVIVAKEQPKTKPKSKKEVVIVAKEQPKTKPKSKKEVVIVAKEQPKTKPKSKKEVVIVAKEQPKTKPKSKKEVVIVAKEQPKTKPKSKKEVVIVAKEQPKTKPKSKKEVVIVAKEQPKTKPKSKKEVVRKKYNGVVEKTAPKTQKNNNNDLIIEDNSNKVVKKTSTIKKYNNNNSKSSNGTVADLSAKEKSIMNINNILDSPYLSLFPDKIDINKLNKSFSKLDDATVKKLCNELFNIGMTHDEVDNLFLKKDIHKNNKKIDYGGSDLNDFFLNNINRSKK